MGNKIYYKKYFSPLGELIMSGDSKSLKSLSFKGQKYSDERIKPEAEEKMTPVFEQTFMWLDKYFAGEKPDFMPDMKPEGSAFQYSVWDILLKIPYGETVSYGYIAKQIALQRGLSSMSAQAVGGAVGRNPIGIIIPCHRVIGENGNLTGYAGGIERKISLLKLEGSFSDSLYYKK